MKRLKFRLAGMLALLILLCFGLYEVKNYDNIPAETEQDEKVLTKISFFDEKMDSLQSIDIINGKESYRIITDNENAVLENVNNEYLNSAGLEHVVNAVRHMEGQVIQDNTDNIEQFGLDNTEYRILVKSQEEEIVFQVGAQMPGGNGRYVMLEGDQTVYLVYGLGDIENSVLEYFNTEIISSQMEDGMVPASIILGGTSRLEELKIGVDSEAEIESVSASKLKLLSHHDYAINYENLTEPLQNLTSIQADHVVCYEPTKGELKKYGLFSPYSTISYSWKDTKGEIQTCELSASTPQNGEVFLMRTGVPLIYEVSLEKVPWVEWQYIDVVTRFLLLPNIYEVESVEIEGISVYEKYELASEDNVLRSVTDTEKEQLDTDKFKKLYQCLIGIPALTYIENAPDSNQNVLKIIFYYKDGRPESQIELLDGPPLQNYLSINGVTEFLTDSKYADIILENIKKLKNGDEVQSLY